MKNNHVVAQENTDVEIDFELNNRYVYHQYVSEILTSIIYTCQLTDGRVNLCPRTQCCQFKLRDLNGNMFDTFTLDGSYTYSDDDSLIRTHLAALNSLSTPQSGTERLTELIWKSSGGAQSYSLLNQVNNQEHIFSFNSPYFLPISEVGDYLATLITAIWEVVDLFVDGELFLPKSFLLNEKAYVVNLNSPTTKLILGERTEITKNFRSQPLHSISGTEPTILLLAWHWSLINAFLDFEKEELNINSLALNNNSHWVVPSRCHPSEIYEYLARICNVACKFCYLFGNPKGMAVARGKKIVSKSEIETRFSYYSPEEGQSLFHSQWELNEFLLDPNLESILKRIRQKSTKPFFFVTNGNPLTHKVMDILSQVKPVYLIISTNTLDAPLRSEVMGEKQINTRTALSCLEYLKGYEIPFGVSLIAFPDISFEELTRTVKALEKVSPAFVRVNMPGFTKDHPIKFEHDTDQVWMNAVEWVREARKKVNFPIISIPSSYELNVYDKKLNEPIVTGVIRNSPAEIAGIRANDVIKSINGMPIELRSDILSLISFMRGSIDVVVERDNSEVRIELDLTVQGTYPYEGSVFGKYMFPYGIVLAPGLTRTSATEIKNIIESTQSEDIWIITSEVMENSAVDLLERCIPEILPRTKFIKAKNLFLGGNIRIMDMCTIGDFYAAIESELDKSKAPDLVIIPGTGFNRFGRDLSGRHWSDLNREFPFHVRILNTNSQFAF
jgi:wyosine [tRNA(Phe)-imidazoG37] synthetase (radical SAM superfamily)